IPSQNVDTTTMVVTVQESTSNTYTREFKAAEDITTITGDSPIYYVEENENLEYSVYFGDGVLGYKPKNGNIIGITYLDNVGARSNNISKFSFSGKVDGVYSNNVRVSVISGTYGGIDKETPEQIRFRAPYFYSAQNRAVTVNDYEALITKDYQNIDAVSVWGGEENDPVVYGKVYMSLKTKGYYSLTNLEKEMIKKSLIESRNVLTVIPEIIDPNYIFLQVRGKVTYNSTLTSKTVGELQQIIRDAVNSYNNNELNTFRSTFRKSKLQYYIENSDPCITGSDINVYLQSRNLITLNQKKNYEIKFNTPLQKGTFLEKLFTYPQITVLDSSSVSRNVFFEEVPESYTGVDSIDIVNAGINYNNPTVNITGDGIGATATAQVVNGKIRTITVTNKGSGYTRAYVNIVDDRNGSEAIAIARLEAKYGVLRTFYYKDNGEKVIVNSAAGTVNYETGEVVLSSVLPSAVIKNDLYDTNILTVSVVPDSEIIPPLRNRILTIEEG
ncbi:hypothetical protein EB001_25090, partial [bacterium]|nr:hypothetical protein [bacterium]